MICRRLRQSSPKRLSFSTKSSRISFRKSSKQGSNAQTCSKSTVSISQKFPVMKSLVLPGALLACYWMNQRRQPSLRISYTITVLIPVVASKDWTVTGLQSRTKSWARAMLMELLQPKWTIRRSISPLAQKQLQPMTNPYKSASAMKTKPWGCPSWSKLKRLKSHPHSRLTTTAMKTAQMRRWK